MIENGTYVTCKDRPDIHGVVDSRSYENGWCYTVMRPDGSYFYRDESALVVPTHESE